MTLGKDLYGSDGRVLLRENMILTSRYIMQLQRLGFTYVYIQDSDTVDIEIVQSVSTEVQQEVVQRIKRVYDKISDPKHMQRMIDSGELGSEFRRLFDILFDEMKRNETFVMNMSSIFASDAFLYTHCMNVGVYASALAIAHGYREDRIKDLGIGAMLHDVGKLMIDKSILDKPGRLTEEERGEIEKHAWYGYQILTQQRDIPTVAAHCALQHHEKFDGSGYPRGLKGKEIHEFGRLLAVPDVYDALTSNRVYRKAFLPHEALEFLYVNVDSHFDRHFVELFNQHVNIYPPGLPVELSNGLTGVIARTNVRSIHRPIVLVLSESGHDVTPYELDLSTHPSVMIVDCNLETVNFAAV